MTRQLTDRAVVALDLSRVTDKAALMDAVAAALALPDWFGRNWDALLDSLCDPSVWPTAAADRGLLLVVTGWTPYADARPDEWRVAHEIFTEASEGPEPVTVALALG
ncbi:MULTISPECIES: barstar family protein [Streptomyces]|uniref:barstar family protein n=1 Tax=Streptomyces TaxID=1883 RepID=UPI00085C8910|nr:MULTISPECIES: barstar family protein [unclassified Streptomyces]QLJ01441.1 barstar family protein [Streptomyces sp. NEAU-sy36]SFY47936.1 hypothetical protein STEPF1_01153 [Streptomyces sp. F-1]